MKDTGGLVTDYQAQTELYRASNREVRLHECRSACTLALSLPNVCVYPDSILKFHLAYDMRNRQTDFNVSQQLFDSYPAAVRARLGGLTRDYKVLRGSELIALGVRNCNEDRVMVAAAQRKAPAPRGPAPAQPAEQGSFFGGLMQNMMAALSGSGARPDPARDRIAVARAVSAAKPNASEPTPIEAPLPPARPAGLAAANGAGTNGARVTGAVTWPDSDDPAPTRDAAEARISEAEITAAPIPPQRPLNVTHAYAYRLAAIPLPKIITGAQPILPPGFRAYAPLDR
jgi:hypothetical protein